MTTSRPSSRAGIDSSCTRLGVFMSCRVRAARTRALTPTSANVCNEAPGFLSLCSYLPELQDSVLRQKERTRAGDATVRRAQVYRIGGDETQSRQTAARRLTILRRCSRRRSVLLRSPARPKTSAIRGRGRVDLRSAQRRSVALRLVPFRLSRIVRSYFVPVS